MTKLRDKVSTFQGDVMIATESSFLFFFGQPRSSITPLGFSDFGRRLGFQAIYNTSDPTILEQLHRFWFAAVAAGSFEVLLMDAKNGSVDFTITPGFEHLRGCIIGFHA